MQWFTEGWDPILLSISQASTLQLYGNNIEFHSTGLKDEIQDISRVRIALK